MCGTLIYSVLCLKPDGKVRCQDQDIFYIQSDQIEAHGSSTRRRPVPQIRIYTESGMIDAHTWDVVFTGFLGHIKNITSGQNYVVFMDNLPQHTQLHTIEKGLDHQVECIFLVKGTS